MIMNKSVCWLKTMGLAVICLFVASELWAGSRSKRQEPVLILYDSAGPFGWIGDIHARMLANLVGHFDLPCLVKPVEAYEAGSLRRAQAVFYLGTTYDNPLPESFLRDVRASVKPVCWFKYNLWQLSLSPGFDFAARTGFRFDYLDGSGYETVTYRGETFGKNPLDPELGRTTIVNPALASAPAWACREDGTSCIPYAVRGSNFWYIADSPFAFLDEEDRYLIFCDLLHDILGINHPEQHRAIIRIEDIDARTSPAALQAITDVLAAEEVPFLLSVVPVHADPLGYYNGGVPQFLRVAQTPALQQVLTNAVKRGGQIVLHGYTHQYGATPNPYHGVSGDDFEFLRATLDDAGNFARFEPVPEDSYKWARTRLRAAQKELRAAGFTAVAWSTPHYAASALDSVVFGEFFPLTIQRAIYFEGTGQIVGTPGRGLKWRGQLVSRGRFGGQFFPYVIQQDIYGLKVVPENLGNVDLPVLSGAAFRQPADMIRIARKNRVVRDGWANGFFHAFLDPALLQELLVGISQEGYTFVPLRADLR
jgi:uncharacterized protein YdaL